MATSRTWRMIRRGNMQATIVPFPTYKVDDKDKGGYEVGWTKADYEGRVCWEQSGQRVFDTMDIERIENREESERINITNSGVGIGWMLLVISMFAIGVLIGSIVF